MPWSQQPAPAHHSKLFVNFCPQSAPECLPESRILVTSQLKIPGWTGNVKLTSPAEQGRPVDSPLHKLPLPTEQARPVDSPLHILPLPTEQGRPVDSPLCKLPSSTQQDESVDSPMSKLPSPAEQDKSVDSPLRKQPSPAEQDMSVDSPMQKNESAGLHSPCPKNGFNLHSSNEHLRYAESPPPDEHGRQCDLSSSTLTSRHDEISSGDLRDAHNNLLPSGQQGRHLQLCSSISQVRYITLSSESKKIDPVSHDQQGRILLPASHDQNGHDARTSSSLPHKHVELSSCHEQSRQVEITTPDSPGRSVQLSARDGHTEMPQSVLLSRHAETPQSVKLGRHIEWSRHDDQNRHLGLSSFVDGQQDTVQPVLSVQPALQQDNRPLNSGLDENRPFNSCLEENRSFNGGLEKHRPLNDVLEENIPFNCGLEEYRPLHSSLKENIPFNNGLEENIPLYGALEENRPFNSSLEENRPFNCRLEENRPFNCSLEENRPFNCRLEENRPFNCGLEENRSLNGGYSPLWGCDQQPCHTNSSPFCHFSRQSAPSAVAGNSLEKFNAQCYDGMARLASEKADSETAGNTLTASSTETVLRNSRERWTAQGLQRRNPPQSRDRNLIFASGHSNHETAGKALDAAFAKPVSQTTGKTRDTTLQKPASQTTESAKRANSEHIYAEIGRKLMSVLQLAISKSADNRPPADSQQKHSDMESKILQAALPLPTTEIPDKEQRADSQQTPEIQGKKRSIASQQPFSIPTGTQQTDILRQSNSEMRGKNISGGPRQPPAKLSNTTLNQVLRLIITERTGRNPSAASQQEHPLKANEIKPLLQQPDYKTEIKNRSAVQHQPVLNDTLKALLQQAVSEIACKKASVNSQRVQSEITDNKCHSFRQRANYANVGNKLSVASQQIHSQTQNNAAKAMVKPAIGGNITTVASHEPCTKLSNQKLMSVLQRAISELAGKKSAVSHQEHAGTSDNKQKKVFQIQTSESAGKNRSPVLIQNRSEVPENKHKHILQRQKSDQASKALWAALHLANAKAPDKKIRPVTQPPDRAISSRQLHESTLSQLLARLRSAGSTSVLQSSPRQDSTTASRAAPRTAAKSSVGHHNTQLFANKALTTVCNPTSPTRAELTGRTAGLRWHEPSALVPNTPWDSHSHLLASHQAPYGDENVLAHSSSGRRTGKHLRTHLRQLSSKATNEEERKTCFPSSYKQPTGISAELYQKCVQQLIKHQSHSRNEYTFSQQPETTISGMPAGRSSGKSMGKTQDCHAGVSSHFKLSKSGNNSTTHHPSCRSQNNAGLYSPQPVNKTYDGDGRQRLCAKAEWSGSVSSQGAISAHKPESTSAVGQVGGKVQSDLGSCVKALLAFSQPVALKEPNDNTLASLLLLANRPQIGDGIPSHWPPAEPVKLRSHLAQSLKYVPKKLTTICPQRPTEGLPARDTAVSPHTATNAANRSAIASQAMSNNPQTRDAVSSPLPAVVRAADNAVSAQQLATGLETRKRRMSTLGSPRMAGIERSSMAAVHGDKEKEVGEKSSDSSYHAKGDSCFVQPEPLSARQESATSSSPRTAVSVSHSCQSDSLFSSSHRAIQSTNSGHATLEVRPMSRPPSTTRLRTVVPSSQAEITNMTAGTSETVKYASTESTTDQNLQSLNAKPLHTDSLSCQNMEVKKEAKKEVMKQVEKDDGFLSKSSCSTRSKTDFSSASRQPLKRSSESVPHAAHRPNELLHNDIYPQTNDNVDAAVARQPSGEERQCILVPCSPHSLSTSQCFPESPAQSVCRSVGQQPARGSPTLSPSVLQQPNSLSSTSIENDQLNPVSSTSTERDQLNPVSSTSMENDQLNPVSSTSMENDQLNPVSSTSTQSDPIHPVKSTSMQRDQLHQVSSKSLQETQSSTSNVTDHQTDRYTDYQTQSFTSKDTDHQTESFTSKDTDHQTQSFTSKDTGHQTDRDTDHQIQSYTSTDTDHRQPVCSSSLHVEYPHPEYSRPLSPAVIVLQPQPREADQAQPREADQPQPREADQAQPREADQAQPREADQPQPREADHPQPAVGLTMPVSCQPIYGSHPICTQPVSVSSVQPQLGPTAMGSPLLCAPAHHHHHPSTITVVQPAPVILPPPPPPPVPIIVRTKKAVDIKGIAGGGSAIVDNFAFTKPGKKPDKEPNPFSFTAIATTINCCCGGPNAALCFSSATVPACNPAPSLAVLFSRINTAPACCPSTSAPHR